MNTEWYSELLKQLKQSSGNFLGSSSQELTDEVEEDIKEIINVLNIFKCEFNIDGTVKTVPQLLTELETANHRNDKQKCIETIAMLRVAISNIETAFSNSVDSMESLIVSIRDEPTR